MNGILKYTVAAILIAIPLYPKFPFIDVPGTFVSIRLEDLLIAFASIVLLMYIVKTREIKRVFNSEINRSILLYIVIGLVSVLSAVWVTKTVSPVIGVLHWLRRIEYFIPFILGVYAIYSDRTNLRFYVNILLVVVFVTFLYGFGQKYYYWPIIITQNEEYSKGVALRYVPGGHINSTFAGHYDLGTFLIVILPLLVSVAINFRGYFKYLYSGAFLSGLWLLVNSASRVSLASYLISVILSLILQKKKRYIPLVLVVTLIFASTSSNLLARYKRIMEVSVQKIQNFNLLNYVVTSVDAREESIFPEKITVTPVPTSIPVFEDRSSNIRLNVEWPRAIRALQKNPLLGTGYSSITLATDNDYLRSLGEVGLLGFLAFSLVILRIILEFVKKIPFDSNFSGLNLIYVTSLFASIPGVLLNAVFIDVFEASKFAILFWLLMGLAVGLLTIKNENTKNNH